MEVLSAKQMYEADRLTIDAGTPGIALMENAGAAVVEEIEKRFPFSGSLRTTLDRSNSLKTGSLRTTLDRSPVLVLCGTGNNGGDGFVIARRLKEKSRDVSVRLIGDAATIKGDAKIAYERWREAGGRMGEIQAELYVDALFGIGLTRPVESTYKEAIGKIAALRKPVVAVDIPSGINADTGEVMGVALPATLTVTFFRPKPGHYLEPGKTCRGELVVRDIGIPESVLKAVNPRIRLDSQEQLITLDS